MSKFLLTYVEEENKRALYAYMASSNKRIRYDIVKGEEALALLRSLSSKEIVRIQRKNNNAKELVFDTGHVLVIDDNRVFNHTGSIADNYIDGIREHIIDYRRRKRQEKEIQEKKNLNNWKKTLPKGFVPKVNRNRSNNIGRLIVVGGVVLGLALGTIVYLLRDIPENKETRKIAYQAFMIPERKPYFEDFLRQKIYDKIDLSGINPSEAVTIEESSTSDILLAFRNRSEDGKLAETERYYGDIIQYYSNRYGLPYSLNCAQITQERPAIVNGVCENLCQIAKSHLGEHFHVPVYDENGFTGTYDDFTVTEDMLNTPEGSIMFSIAYNRKNVDKYDNLGLGYFFYNHGPNSLKFACDYYGVDIEEYSKPQNVILARDLIVDYYREIKPDGYGDPNYLENIFSYLRTEDRGSITLKFYIGNELKTITLTNQNLIDKSVSEDYNNNLTRG